MNTEATRAADRFMKTPLHVQPCDCSSCEQDARAPGAPPRFEPDAPAGHVLACPCWRCREINAPASSPPDVETLILFLEWLDCSREVTAWGRPEESHEHTARRYLEEIE